jgi:hypothetical protein
MRLKRVEETLAPAIHGQSHVSVHNQADEKSNRENPRRALRLAFPIAHRKPEEPVNHVVPFERDL